MKLKKRRASEVPSKIKTFIDNVITAPLESIEDSLRNFVWDFDKGDFHHWVDLFNHFDVYFEKYIKPRKDLQLGDDFLSSDPPFPKAAVLQILRVVRNILDNCTNKHFYSSYEQHLSFLLASTDADVVEACLQTLASFLKKTLGKYSIRDSSLNSKLFAFAQGWGGKEEGLGLTACALENGCDSIAYQLGCTLHFEFYAADDLSGETGSTSGLQIIHLQNISSCSESDLELLHKLVEQHKVPVNLRFQLLTRLRFARAFSSLSSRQQYMCICLYAFVVLVQASTETDDLVTFLNSEPEFINELVSLLSFEDAVPEKVRILSLLSLVALCQDRSRQPTVLVAVTSGGHRGILSSLMQKAIDSVLNQSSKWSVIFAEALLSLVTVLVSSSSGCSAMREAGFIPTLLPLLKDTDSQHLHLVSTAVHVLEAFMDYSNPAAALFRDLGGLDDTIYRLKEEVTITENSSSKLSDDSSCGSRSSDEIEGTPSALDDVQPLYSDAMVAYHRRLLLKALLRAISLGTYAPGNTTRIYSSEESLLPHCLCVIFRKAKDFGGGVFSLAATVMSDLIHKDPASFDVIDAAGLPSAFMDAIMDNVLCSAEAITCIPQCLDALCLNNNGIQAVKERNALSCFVKIFTSKSYLRALAGDTPASLSTGLDELMRHASALRVPGVEMLIEILNTIVKIGSGADAAASTSADSGPSLSLVPMDTDAEEKSSAVDGKSSKMECIDPAEVSSDSSSANVESFLPDFVSNVARLLETILQNADMCRIFIEKKGIDAVLQIFTLPLLPLSVSVGQSISFAFKNFSHQYSAALARTVCPFLKQHLLRTNEILDSVGGTCLVQLESVKKTKVLRCLSSLEGILALSNSLLKGTTSVISELGAGDTDLLKDLGWTYREVLWQLSLICNSKVDEKSNVDTDAESTIKPIVNGVARENEDDSGTPVLQFMNPVSIRSSGSQSQWGGERDFLSVIRAGEGFNRRSRHNGMTRMRGGRVAHHLDTLNIDSEVAACVQDTSSLQELKKKSPDALISEILTKLASTLRSFFTALVKGFTSPNRRRADTASLSSAAKNIGAAMAKVFLEALSFSGYSSIVGLDMSLSVKCRYLGKVVDDMAAVTFDSRRRLCYTSIVNNLYVSGAFKELLTTFEATSQLLWTLPPYSMPSTSAILTEKRIDGSSKLAQNSWLIETLQSYCRMLEFFVNSSLLLSASSTSHSQLLVQPAAIGLSIGLFPVPRDPEVFVRMLQSQVLDVILPVWNHPMFPSCSPSFITAILSLVTCIYSGVGDVKRNRGGAGTNINQRVAPPPDETTISTIVEMGFSRARAEEALRRVGSNSVEMAMEWLCNHAEDPVQEDDELARALALSLGSSNETPKSDNTDKPVDVSNEEGQMKALPVDDILTASMKLFQRGDSMAFPLTELLVTLCNRNKGEDCVKVTSYLIQQLKLCPIEFGNDSSAVATIAHILALLLSEDSGTREVAARDGLVSVAIDILSNFKTKNESENESISTRCVSAVLLIVDSLLQPSPKASPGISSEPTPGSSGLIPSEGKIPVSIPELPEEKQVSLHQEDFGFLFQNVLGKSTGYLSMEESHKVLSVACDLLKQYVPAVVMQALLQLCARLTKTHSLALQFLESGGMAYLFNLPRSCFFHGYDTLASAIVRHLLEDPQTLQIAMESEIRQVLSGSRHSGRVVTRSFLTSMAPLISRDPVVFIKAASAVCQLETSGGRNIVVLIKDKEKDKHRSKAEGGPFSNEPLKVPETRPSDGPGKCPRFHKKIPANLTQVLDQLLEIVFQFPSSQGPEDCLISSISMDLDEPTTKVKGKSKVDDMRKIEMESSSEKSASLAKVTFVLKLLSEILLMYAHAVGVILKRDTELCQTKGSCQGDGGIVHHVLRRVLPHSVDKTAGPTDLREKLSDKASWFLVVLCGRSSEGRRRVISELVKALSSYSTVEGNSLKNSLLPERKVLAFTELIYSILSKNYPSNNLPVSGYSPDIAKSMIDGGVVLCLTNILQAIDLDHPDAPKVSNLILKALEVLTRAANTANDQASKTDALNKIKSAGSQDRSEDQVAVAAIDADVEHNHARVSEQEGEQENLSSHQLDGTGPAHNNERDGNQDGVSSEQDMRDDQEGGTMATNPPLETGPGFVQEEMEEGAVIPIGNQIHVNYHVQNRAEVHMGDDDDMGDEGDEEDEEDEVEEDEDIAEDGAALMSLADTDVDDHEDAGLVDEYNDEIGDEEDDDFHENRVIEVSWREALGGFSHLQVLGQSGPSLIDVSSEAFEGVNVDDLFGVRRSLGFERRRQTNNRTSFDRNNPGGVLQHPLMSRPSNGVGSSSRASGGIASRGAELLPGEHFDVAQYYMFDAPILSSDQTPASLYGDRTSDIVVPPILTDFSTGVNSLHLNGRRVAGDGRWADDGQPQAGGQASSIAEAVEDLFVSLLRSSGGDAKSTKPAQNSGKQEIQPAMQENSNAISEMERDESGSGHEGHTGIIAVTVTEQGTARHAEDLAHDHANQIDPSTGNAGRSSEGNEVFSCNVDVTDNGVDGHQSMEIGDDNGILDNQTGCLQDPDVSSVDLHNSAQTEGGPQITAEIQDVPMQPVGCHESNDSSTHSINRLTSGSEVDIAGHVGGHSHVVADVDVEMNGVNVEASQAELVVPTCELGSTAPSVREDASIMQDADHLDQSAMEDDAPAPTGIDPTFLEALPEDLRAEVLASQQSQPVQPPEYTPPSIEDIDPEFLAALPPDIQAEVLAQQRAQRVAQQAVGQPVEMDNASIIATLPADLREEVLLTSSEAVLSELPSPLQAEAQMLRDRTMSPYQAHSLLGSRHGLTSRRNGLGFGQNALMDRGVGVTIGRRLASSFGDTLKVKEIEGEPLLNADALNALIRLLRLSQPLSKGLLQRLMLNLCAHSVTRATLVRLLLNMIKPEADGLVGSIVTVNRQRLYGCPPNIVYGRSQLLDGLPPLVLRRVLEALTYLATNHAAVANILFYFDPSLLFESSSQKLLGSKNSKGKEKMKDDGNFPSVYTDSQQDNIPFVLFLRLLNQPLFVRSIVHLEQVMGLLQVVVYTAAAKLENQSIEDQIIAHAQEMSATKPSDSAQEDMSSRMEPESTPDKDTEKADTLCEEEIKVPEGNSSHSQEKRSNNIHDIFLQLPQSDLCNISRLLGKEGLSDKVYSLAGEVLKKLASVVPAHRKFFTVELSDCAQALCQTAASELSTLKSTNMVGLSAGSMAGVAVLRVLQVLCSLAASGVESNKGTESAEEDIDKAILRKLNASLELLWKELSEYISVAETLLGQSNLAPAVATPSSVWDNINGALFTSPSIPPGTQWLLPFIEAFFLLCEKLQSNNFSGQQDQSNVTVEIKESDGCNPTSLPMKGSGGDAQRRFDGMVTFSRFAEKHRQLLNVFIRQNPALLEKSLSLMLKAPRLIDFDNKKAYFRSKIRQQHDQHLTGPLRISVRRAYLLEDSYNQLRMRPTQDLKGRLNVHFVREEGVDAGGLTREWYQLLSRVIFDKGALLFTTVGNNATFQPNPNSVYQTEHLSYFKFVGRVVAKALFDGQLLDVYFTRSFYKHILGVKVTYHDIEAVDPDYYKNLKWMLENDVSDIPDLTFSMDPDEEKHILYEKTEVTDYELKPGGRNIRVTEETKQEYVDLVADHILTNAIRPQINSFLEGFNELVPRELISIFNDKELELLISGLPEIDLNDLKANSEYTGYTAASSVVQWFWEVVGSFNKEDMARFLQFVTGTSKVPLEGFRALQGISGPQRFQIHKAYGAPERLPSAHTCFNQLDLPEYPTKEQLKDRLLLAIHEASEGFGFG